MLRGLYTAALGMTTQMKRMDVVSNNIANVDTTGYKKDIAVTSSFDDELVKRTHDLESQKLRTFPKRVGNITMGVYVDTIHTDFMQGNIHATNNTFDLSLGGQGFFVVKTFDNNGNATEKYTRDGSFTLDKDGYLVTSDGGRVQGTNGDIQLPVGMTVIEKNGEIQVNLESIAQIKTVDFEDLQTLRKQGDNYYTATSQSKEKPCESQVLQGTLEVSNVNTVREMVDLITVNRTYEANQKIVQAIDQSLQRSVQEIGRK